jgi:hypothetical protein
MKIPTAPALAGGFLVLFALVIAGAFVTADHDLIRALAQGLLNIVVAVAAFYFGSSAGSQAKDATIAAALGVTAPAEPETGAATRSMADRAL